MPYKEQLEELYIKLNNELIILRSRRPKRLDIYKIKIDSLNTQIRLIKEQLDDLNTNKPRVR